MNIVYEWYHRTMSDPQAVILAVLLAAGFIVMLTLGQMLAPVLAGVVIAYLLDGVVEKIHRLGVPRVAAVVIVFLLFMSFLVFALFWLVPRLSYQVTQLLRQLPDIIGMGQSVMLQLPEKYPNLFTVEQVNDLGQTIRSEITELSQRVLSLSLPAVFGLITILVYMVLVPVLAFFFLKDKERIVSWINHRVPQQRRLVDVVARDVNIQVSNYVRGKVWEIFIVGGAAFVTFRLMGLEYALLLATMTGLSVIIPYIGAVVVTFPVAIIAWFQWGWSTDFGWMLAAYVVLQMLDGYLLVPLLFSEVVNLHPVAIIVAILVFGGLWGFWGVFFAIPLATLVQAVMQAWPRKARDETAAGPGAPEQGAGAHHS
ncbi:MAG: AI-2E family transporter [Pseudomonadota bacterium]